MTMDIEGKSNSSKIVYLVAEHQRKTFLSLQNNIIFRMICLLASNSIL